MIHIYQKIKNRDIWYYSEDEIELVESGYKNMECNYEMIDKRETIVCLLSGEIDIDGTHKIYAVDMKNEEINEIRNMYFEEIMNCIEDKNVMFFQLKEED